MIERVARAICSAEKMNEDDPLVGWVHWREAAIAAIDAMSKPTPKMVDHGTLNFPIAADYKAHEYAPAAKQIYQAMVESVLKY